jgi:hypothetical protein
MANKRVFYACQAVAIASPSDPDDSTVTPKSTEIMHGIQSVGVTTNFNLEQVFELGQIQIYENIENVPDVEVTLEKVFDGYKSILNAATQEAFEDAQLASKNPTIVARSKERSKIIVAIYDETKDSVSDADKVYEMIMDGMYISNIAINIPVDGNVTESVSFVGNSKVFTTGAGGTGLTNVDTALTEDVDGAGTDKPLNLANANGGVQRRENVDLHESEFPTTVRGAFGTGVGNGVFKVPLANANVPRIHVQNISISTDFSREDILELGRKAPYYRSPNFPIEVTCDIEAISPDGDGVQAFEEGNPANAGTANAGNNTPEETIKIVLDDGSSFDLKSKNRLSSVTYGGGDASGGNVSVTYSYTNFNDLVIS